VDQSHKSDHAFDRIKHDLRRKIPIVAKFSVTIVLFHKLLNFHASLVYKCRLGK